MVKPELTGERDLTFHKWHRTLPSHCYMVDLDCIEWRSEKGIVALIELARHTAIVYKKKFQCKVIKELATKAKIPAFLVLYNDELTYFEVYDILSGEEITQCTKRIMGQNEFRSFIESLGSKVNPVLFEKES